MLRLRSVRLSVLTVAAVLAGTATASASRQSSPEDRIDTVLAEFDAIVTDAGFVLDGERGEIDDPLGLNEQDDSTTADDCLPDGDGVVADDGSFVGQLAGSSSGQYQFAGGEPVATDAMDWLAGESMGIAVAILDDEATARVRAAVEALSTDEFADCLETAFDDWLAERADERQDDDSEADDATAAIDASVSVEALDIGDAAALFSVRQSGEDDNGERHTVAASVATATVGDTFVAVGYTTFTADDNSDVVIPALEAAVAAA